GGGGNRRLVSVSRATIDHCSLPVRRAPTERHTMARIAGVDLPPNKQARIALTYIFGIGQPRALKILDKAGVDPYAKMPTLDEDQLNKIRNVIEQEGEIEGDLRKEVGLNIKRLIEIQSNGAWATPPTLRAPGQPPP